MKKIISALLCISIIFAFAGCSKNEAKHSGTNETESSNTSQKMEMILTPAEYVLYENIFFNDQSADYVDKETTKKGIFTILYDEYAGISRYYVWGYKDNTKCCDWQWEFVPKDVNSLPNVGSTVNVTGMFVKDDNALDGFWISDASVEILTELSPTKLDVDTTTMGGTLERVQVANMQQFPEKFEGKSVSVYGRIESATSVQHPYYDNCFSQEFESSDEVKAIGSTVVVEGVYSNGKITDATVSESNDF